MSSRSSHVDALNLTTPQRQPLKASRRRVSPASQAAARQLLGRGLETYDGSTAGQVPMREPRASKGFVAATVDALKELASPEPTGAELRRIKVLAAANRAQQRREQLANGDRDPWDDDDLVDM